MTSQELYKMNKQIAQLTLTTSACPTQCEGKMETGENIYARNRHGKLKVYLYKGDLTEEVLDNEDYSVRVYGDQIYSMDLNQVLDKLEHLEFTIPNTIRYT